MSARQLIVLAVAFVAAIGALLIIRGIGPSSEAPATEISAPVAGVPVLVATRAVGQGVALSAGDMAWVTFPEGSISPSYITSTTNPEGLTELSGAVTRRTFVQGEPIIQGSVVQPEGRSMMAAQLAPGYRAVAIQIKSEIAAAGYIQPNDRVDVIVTARIDGRGDLPDETRSDVLLQDVRVLAIGETTQPPPASADGPPRTTAEMALLELTPEDARLLAVADDRGDVSLVLRGVEAEAPGFRAPTARRSAGALEREVTSVRIHSFGQVSGGGQ